MDISLLKIPLKNRLEVVQLEKHRFGYAIDAEWILVAISIFVFSIALAAMAR